MKKYLLTIFLSFFTLLFFVSTVSALSSTEIENQLNNQLDYLNSTENYIKYLKEEINNDNELAVEGLEQFLALSEKEQDVFLQAVQQTDKILLAISGTEESIIEIDGYEVPVKLEAEDITFNELIQVPITIMGSRTVTATQNLYVGNIRVTTIYSQVSTGTRATSIITSDHWHRNINPAIIWSKQTSSNQTYMGNNNSRAYHRGDWIIYATGGLGFINETVKFWVSGDAVYRSKQFYSTHPNFNNYSWTPF